MGDVRVYELARDLGIPILRVVELANKVAVPVRGPAGIELRKLNHMSQLSKGEIDGIRRMLSNETRPMLLQQPIRSGVVRRAPMNLTGMPIIEIEPEALRRVLYEHARGPVSAPWPMFAVKTGDNGVVCVFHSATGSVKPVAALSQDGTQQHIDAYPGMPVPGRDYRFRGRALEHALQCIVRAVTALAAENADRRESDVRVLLPSAEETDDRVVYVYLSPEWVESRASHCVLVRRGAMPHMRRGHWRKQRVGKGRLETKEVFVKESSVKHGRGWAEYRVRSARAASEKEKPATK